MSLLDRIGRVLLWLARPFLPPSAPYSTRLTAKELTERERELRERALPKP